MLKFQNDMPNSNIRFIITHHVPKSPVDSAEMVVHYKDSPAKVFHCMEIAEATEEFSYERNYGGNSVISRDLEKNVKESLSALFGLYALRKIDCIPQSFFDGIQRDADKLQELCDKENEKQIAKEITDGSDEILAQRLASAVPFSDIPNQPTFSHNQEDAYSLPNVPSNEYSKRSYCMIL